MQMRKQEEGSRASLVSYVSRLTGGRRKMQDGTGMRGGDEEMEQLKEGVRCLCSLPSSVSRNVRAC